MVISVRQSTVAAISGLHCRALVMVSSSIRLDSLIAKFKEAGGTVRRLMYEQSHRDYLRSVICIIVCLLRVALTIIRITPLPTKPSATKCQRTEAGERGNY